MPAETPVLAYMRTVTRRSLRSGKNALCGDHVPSVFDLVGATKPFDGFVLTIGMGVLYRKLSRQRDFATVHRQ